MLFGMMENKGGFNDEQPEVNRGFTNGGVMLKHYFHTVTKTIHTVKFS